LLRDMPLGGGVLVHGAVNCAVLWIVLIDRRVCIDAMGLSEKGKAHELVEKGDITFGGKYLINPSGGLISKGHPIGATGLAQASELVPPHSLLPTAL
jgi:hypothetical protein